MSKQPDKSITNSSETGAAPQVTTISSLMKSAHSIGFNDRLQALCL